MILYCENCVKGIKYKKEEGTIKAKDGCPICGGQVIVREPEKERIPGKKPPAEKTDTLHIRIRPETKKLLHEISGRKNCSVSDLIENMVSYIRTIL